MTRYALLGHPVAHSLSPALHSHWFARHGIDATYTAIELDPARADEIGPFFRGSGLAGANLTVPFKAAILPDLDRITDIARVAGSVNTLWWDGDRLCGDTTDARGFVDALEATAPLDPSRPAVILGAGGAGRAVAAGLAQRGFRSITLLNRTPERAERAAEALRAHFLDTRFSSGPFEAWSARVSGAGLVASCVSGPGRASVAALDPGLLPSDCRWCDLNYWDPDPPHRDALGARFDDGRQMLVHQAALAFERWTSIRPDPADLPALPP